MRHALLGLVACAAGCASMSTLQRASTQPEGATEVAFTADYATNAPLPTPGIAAYHGITSSTELVGRAWLPGNLVVGIKQRLIDAGALIVSAAPEIHAGFPIRPPYVTDSTTCLQFDGDSCPGDSLVQLRLPLLLGLRLGRSELVASGAVVDVVMTSRRPGVPEHLILVGGNLGVAFPVTDTVFLLPEAGVTQQLTRIPYRAREPIVSGAVAVLVQLPR